ncbi:MAG: anti-sigma factor family protein [Bryobacteraceae bacterium]
MAWVMEHLTDADLELYCLGRATNEELAPIEEHLLACPDCVARVEQMLAGIDTLRAALWRLEQERRQNEPQDPAGRQNG